MIKDAFDTLYEDGADTGMILPIGLHPFVAGPAYRIKAVDRALAYINRHEKCGRQQAAKSPNTTSSRARRSRIRLSRSPAFCGSRKCARPCRRKRTPCRKPGVFDSAQTTPTHGPRLGSAGPDAGRQYVRQTERWQYRRANNPHQPRTPVGQGRLHPIEGGIHFTVGGIEFCLGEAFPRGGVPTRAPSAVGTATRRRSSSSSESFCATGRDRRSQVGT